MTAVAFSSEELAELLQCPVCPGSSPLVYAQGEAFECPACGTTYPVREDIPMLLPPYLVKPYGDDPDPDLAHKRMQMAFFDDGLDRDFEVTRPHGAPALHGWLLAEKIRRGLIAVEPLSSGTTALTVCGGSGMDAEFLARAGVRVILSDISLGAARQACERARRFGFPLTAVVADVESLPFRDSSIDLVYVHDGLHHLARPFRGLDEMARVARRAVSVNEPADAAVTHLAVRLGYALEREEAGNPVRRLTAAEIETALGSRGFRTVESHRYAMYYRHEPGRVMHALSGRHVFPLARLGFRALNRVIGRAGNKLTVQAVRVARPATGDASTPASARDSTHRSR
jgi:ubiquinone/menaquinone biosynthesis C-methylase UbiE/uncharacterized protein YbaR (Trm112 family)